MLLTPEIVSQNSHLVFRPKGVYTRIDSWLLAISVWLFEFPVRACVKYLDCSTALSGCGHVLTFYFRFLSSFSFVLAGNHMSDRSAIVDWRKVRFIEECQISRWPANLVYLVPTTSFRAQSV